LGAGYHIRARRARHAAACILARGEASRRRQGWHEALEVLTVVFRRVRARRFPARICASGKREGRTPHHLHGLDDAPFGRGVFEPRW
jgi:hypothetical protein